MRELPILFSGAMVRALLDGRKKQTRRVAKLPHNNPLGQWEPTTIGGPKGGRTKDGQTIPEQGAIWHTRTGDCLMCPHGQPGDHVWVRETCRADELPGGLDGVRYLADDAFIPIANTAQAAESWIDLNAYRGRNGAVVPAIHMPRWASRITLEVTGARVERLQDISEDDAIAEGIDGPMCAAAVGRAPSRAKLLPAAVHAYAHLWESLNGARGYGWDTNPWVWVVEFKRVTP